jgi:hypothetical protein
MFIAHRKLRLFIAPLGAEMYFAPNGANEESVSFGAINIPRLTGASARRRWQSLRSYLRLAIIAANLSIEIFPPVRMPTTF